MSVTPEQLQAWANRLSCAEEHTPAAIVAELRTEAARLQEDKSRAWLVSALARAYPAWTLTEHYAQNGTGGLVVELSRDAGGGVSFGITVFNATWVVIVDSLEHWEDEHGDLVGMEELRRRRREDERELRRYDELG